MRRTTMALLCSAILTLAGTGAAAAVDDQGCTRSFTLIELRTDYAGGGAPAPGVDAWWDLTVAGFELAEMTAEEVAEAYGFGGDVDSLYEFVLAGILAVDANGTGAICWKHFPPQQHGWPPFFFKVMDDRHLAG